MGKSKNGSAFMDKVLDILKKIGAFFVFIWGKIVEFFLFLKERIADFWDSFMGKNGRKFGIRYKILLGFLIPIIFITIVGLVSYSKAKQGMRDRYEKSTLETVRMVGSQIDMVTYFMRSEVSKYVGSTDLANLTRGAYESNVSEKNRVLKLLKNDLSFSQAVNPYINHIHIVLQSNLKNLSTKSTTKDGFFDEYYESMERDADGKIIKWIDSHPVLDSRMELDTDSGDAYVFSYQDVSTDKRAAIVIDAKKEKIQEFLDGITLGDGTVIGLITMNGKEVLHRSGEIFKDDGKAVFSDKDYYKEAISSENLYGMKEVEYSGEDCIMFYSVCEMSGIVIAAMVPVSVVTAEASTIRTVTIILMLVALALVLAIAFAISSNIQKNVENVSKGLGEVAEGNLTVRVRVKGHDEFGDLAEAATGMIANTKNLVSKVESASNEVAQSAKSVQGATQLLGTCSDDIMKAMGEMSDGMERQKKFANECVDTTDRLSDEIGNVSTQIGKIKDIVEEIYRLINESVRMLGTVGDKAKETTGATDSVKKSVSALLDETGKINSFVDVIRSISSQTHLLSLNASIEAARAGTAGRGFSVVAEEIRNLATESAKSATEIKKLVDGINYQTASSTDSVDQARSIADEQHELVNRSIEIIDRMKASMESLNSELLNIDSATAAADARRVEAVNAVGDISDIINASSANVDTVMKTLNRLKTNVKYLDNTAAKLGENMDELKSEVEVFRI